MSATALPPHSTWAYLPRFRCTPLYPASNLPPALFRCIPRFRRPFPRSLRTRTYLHASLNPPTAHRFDPLPDPYLPCTAPTRAPTRRRSEARSREWGGRSAPNSRRGCKRLVDVTGKGDMVVMEKGRRVKILVFLGGRPPIH